MFLLPPVAIHGLYLEDRYTLTILSHISVHEPSKELLSMEVVIPTSLWGGWILHTRGTVQIEKLSYVCDVLTNVIPHDGFDRIPCNDVLVRRFLITESCDLTCSCKRSLESGTTKYCSDPVSCDLLRCPSIELDVVFVLVHLYDVVTTVKCHCLPSGSSKRCHYGIGQHFQISHLFRLHGGPDYEGLSDLDHTFHIREHTLHDILGCG